MNTPERIKKLLKDAGVEERKVARTLADLCGVTPQSVYQWFDGSTNRISPDYLALIADKYHVSVGWLINGKETSAAYSQESMQLAAPVKIRESGLDYGENGLNEIIDQYQNLPKSGKHAVLAALYRELEKAKSDEN